ncbi:MAG: type VI secretion system protein TssA [Planctomycetes bacterium]|nr:type VI secretion system protein TssA [Planctomycetota bacterium]
MADILDLNKLLEPIPGDRPAGANLRQDPSSTSVYRTIKDACSAARTAERKLLDGDTAANPDWTPVLKLVPEVLAAKSKDLELAAWLLEAIVRKRGFTGLKEGFRLARGLVEKFWDGLYPLPNEEEGVGARVAALGILNGYDNDGLLIAPIGKVPLTGEDPEGRRFARWHYRQAASLEALKSDPVKLQKRLEAGAVTQELINKAEAGASPEEAKQLLDDLTQCLSEFEGLTKLLEEKCGKDPEGRSLAPPSSNIQKALKECYDIVESFARAKLPGEAASPAGGEAAAPGGAEGAASRAATGPAFAISGAIRSRQEAFQVLLKVAQFFKQTEPHSPVSYALERIVRWGRLSLPELLVELIADEGLRGSVFKLVGIQPPENPPGNPPSGQGN